MIPFMDTKALYACQADELEQELLAVARSGSYVLGERLERFEKAFAAYIGVEAAVGVASGTDALRLSFQALKVGSGDEVLLPCNTFIATAQAVVEAGAVPVVVDVDPATALMDLDDAARRLTAKTRAVIPVHLFGQCLNMDRLADFAQAHSLLVVEDACQAHGAMWKGRRAGSFGQTGCFSFYPAKNLGALGDGGIITVSNQALATRLRCLRNHGAVAKYVHEFAGINSRLDELQAGVLGVRLPLLDRWNRQRFAAALEYVRLLEGVAGLRLPEFDREDPERHVFHLFVVAAQGRDRLADSLAARGVQVGIHYPVPVHLQKSMLRFGPPAGGCPAGEALCREIVSLPMFPTITAGQQARVAQAVIDSMEQTA